MVAVSLTATIPLSAIKLELSPSDIERAISIARDQDRVRERFHAPYITPINDPFVEWLEIVTEFRRHVIVAEDRINKGDRAFAYSARLVGDAASMWKNRVSVKARLRFHPHNAYVDIPKLDVSVDGPNADLALIGVLKEPVFSFSEPNQPTSIIGAMAEGVFDATVIGQTRRTVTVRMDGKVLITRVLDFAVVE